MTEAYPAHTVGVPVEKIPLASVCGVGAGLLLGRRNVSERAGERARS
jgi:hypothetical protein